ncbi:MAG: flavin reductase family protein [Rhodobiaceae bacterium]|nr:flavin reductase family protein [Rhodobiaceae bacterium]
MYYDAIINDHGLPHDPFKSLVVPRPIGWISTLSAGGGANLAPYSFFNGLASNPNIVMFSSNVYKDSVRNVDQTGEFVCNMATYDLRDKMNATSAPVSSDVDEFELAGLTKVASRAVAPPRVAECPAALECRHLQTIELTGLDGKSAGAWMVLGQVVGVHIDDTVIIDGRVDVTLFRPLARLGYMQYASVDSVFSIQRPS